MKYPLLFCALTNVACGSIHPLSEEQPIESAECKLEKDGLRQYSTGCVQRQWIASHVGTYTSPTCTLKIDASAPQEIPARMSAAVAGEGTFVMDWTGPNGSYARGVTDDTFSTSRWIKFQAFQDEASVGRSIYLGVDLETNPPTYQGSLQYADTMKTSMVDCGVLKKQ